MGWDIDVKEKVYQRLANEVFFRIYDGRYQLGEKLPSFQCISKESGTSPETVRKAIRELQERGIVERKRQGYFVTQDYEKMESFRHKYLKRAKEQYQKALDKVKNQVKIKR